MCFENFSTYKKEICFVFLLASTEECENLRSGSPDKRALTGGFSNQSVKKLCSYTFWNTLFR